MDFKLKEYFIHDVLPPLLYLDKIYIDANHQLHEELLFDLEMVNEEDVLSYYNQHESQLNFLNHRIPDKMLCAKILLLGDLIANSIYEDRLQALLVNKPYDKNEFDGLYDDEYLIKINKKSKTYDSIFIDNNRYGLCLQYNAFNSSYWISRELNKLNLDEVKLKIRPDPFLKNFSPLILKSTVFSKPLNWNNIRFLRNDDRGKFENYKTGEVTEYLWHPRNNEVIFTCEELPPKNQINLRGSRYFHAIFEKDSGKFQHCDGSIKIYNEKSYGRRLDFSIDNNEVNDIGDEVKIFRVDNNIPKEKFTSLICSYFYWNYDLSNYFSNLVK